MADIPCKDIHLHIRKLSRNRHTQNSWLAIPTRYIHRLDQPTHPASHNDFPHGYSSYR